MSRQLLLHWYQDDELIAKQANTGVPYVFLNFLTWILPIMQIIAARINNHLENNTGRMILHPVLDLILGPQELE